MYPRARLEALSDAIFGVAMTLLVLDLRLPEDFHPADGRALLGAFSQLVPKFFPYALSFLVLGMRWSSGARLRASEYYGQAYFKWWLLYHLLVTCVPFTTTVVGRFANLAPAVWLYAGNTALLAMAGYGMLMQTSRDATDDFFRDRQVSLAMLFATSLLMIACSFASPKLSLLVLALNVVAPALSRGLAGEKAVDDETPAPPPRPQTAPPEVATGETAVAVDAASPRLIPEA